jgi:opacity protein-like surface antigen
MLRPRLFLATIIVLAVVTSAHAQDGSKWLFNIGGGVGFPQGDLSSFVNNGGHFVVGGGYNITRHFAVDTEFMWHDLPINSATKDRLQTPGASARQYAWTVNPIVHFPLGSKLGAYVIGGGGWYHRSGETTTPGVGVICDPYWSWWFGCTIGSVNIVTGSRSDNAFGGNIGGGLTYQLGGRAKFYTEVRYHHASYDKVATDILPLTFGIRW